MTKPPKETTAAPAAFERAPEADEPSIRETPTIRDLFAMHAMGAIITGIVSRGGLPALESSNGADDDGLVAAAYGCADVAMRVRAKL